MAHVLEKASRRQLWTLAAAIAVFAYGVWFRTHGVSDSFALRGDQVRDWTVALRPFSELPLSGVPSTAGGTTIGPAYYWFLWGAARIFGPFADYLPHSGGIAIAVAHSLADALLLVALARRFRSLALVTTIVVMIATAPYDATLSATVWNPPVAEALVKVAIALLIWSPEMTLARGAAATAAGWLALHCHTGAIVVVAPMLLMLIGRPLVERQWRFALARIGSTLAIVGMLQVPWLLYRMQPFEAERSRIESSLTSALMSPLSSLHLQDSAAFVVRSIQFLIFAPLTLPHFQLILAACLAATAFGIRDANLLAVSVGAVIAAIGAFALLQGSLSEVYWCLPLTAPAAIAIFGWIDRTPRLASHALTAIVLVAVIASQPARAKVAWTFHRLPEYGSLVAGCRSILADGRRVRDIGVSFDVPPDTDALWLFSILGGALYADGDATRAVIHRGGTVTYE